MAAGDPYWNNVVLAMHMDAQADHDPYWPDVVFASHLDGTNGATTFTDNGPNSLAITRVGTSTLTTTSPMFGATALNVPTGSGIYASPAAQPTTGPFCIDGWVKVTSTAAAQVVFQWNQNAAIAGVLVMVNAGGGVAGLVSDSSSAAWEVNAAGPANIVAGVWTHVAFVRDASNNFTVYVNGVAGTPVNWAGTIYYGASAIRAVWGISADLTGSPLVGSLDDIRITSGVARYTGNFTPPTTAFVQNNTFTDFKGHPMAAAGAAQISTAQNKFGGASALFSTTSANKVTSVASTDWMMGSAGGYANPFTVEFQMYPTAYNGSGQGDIISASGGTFAFNGTTGVHWYAFITTNSITMQYWGEFAGAAVVAPVSLNVWTHVAFVYDGAQMQVYINGVLSGTTARRVMVPTTTPSLAIGSYPGKADGATNAYTGFIDDVRVTKGVARYTANFTPPSIANPLAPATLDGTVKDATNTLAPRAVRAYRKSDGAFSGAMTSHSTTGAFSIPALDPTPHFALVHDSDADPYWPNVVLATRFDTDSVIDPYMSSVVLGLHMEGANASTVFQEVTGKTMTAAGTAALSTDTARFGNTSGKFGTSTANKVTAAASNDFALSGPFTIEFWIYPTVDNVNGGFVLTAGGGTNAWNTTTGWHWAIIRGATGIYYQHWVSGTTGFATTLFTAPLSSWVHIAYTYDGTNVRVFHDGVLRQTLAATLASPSTTPSLAIGELVGATAGATNVFTGYLDDIRITKGVCRYTTNFTAPTVPFSSFKDLTGKDLMVNGAPTISTATKKYGDGALSLPAAGRNALEVAHPSAFSLGAGNFTIELYVNMSSTAAVKGILSLAPMSTTTVSAFLFYTGTVGTISLYSSSNGASWDIASAVPLLVFTTGVWYHLAAVRVGPTIEVYVDGIRVRSVAVGSSSLIASSGAVIGGWSSADYFNGFIDDLRITKGVARYQANFTPPERTFSGAMTLGTANAQILDDIIPI